jgi:NAD(P)-dependent dehydrogenase (short-subunit alcohol dehydrogenase family)
VEREVRRVLTQRRIRDTFDALEAAGSRVEYHPLDVTDEAAFEALIRDLYARLGRIDGVIHAAGVIEDRRIGEKTAESLARVMRTKLVPARVLARALRPRSLKFLAFFSSVSARWGNAGQSDYAAANECLNKLADHLGRTWPARVVSVGWGPWDAGMVSPALKEAYARLGIQTIPPEAGARAFLDELCRTDRATEVILACTPGAIARGVSRR